MKRLVLLVGLLAGLFGEAVAQENDDYDGVEFRRWSAVVSDLDETIHLYTEILGLQLGDVTVDKKTSYVYEIFNISPNVTTRHATFHAGEKKRVVSVVEVPNDDLNSPPQNPRMSVALFNAKGRFDQILRRLKREGYITMKPHALGSQGIEVGFLDRDGHLYSLYEYPYSGSIKIGAND